MTPLPCRIVRRRRETADTFTLWLRSDSGAFGFAPGQFNMLYAFGAGEVPISVSGDAAKGDLLVHTIRAVGPVTRALERTRRGDLVGVRGPFGSAWPLDLARGSDLLIVAGGIGLAPLRSVVQYARRHHRSFGRLLLAYGARSPSDLLYAREHARWRDRFEVHVTVDRGDPGWTGTTGVVTKLLPALALAPERTVAFVCGPETMMRFVGRELERLGVSAERVFVSTERNMKCAIGHCGHCQLGPAFVCKDGPVFRWDRIGPLLAIKEL